MDPTLRLVLGAVALILAIIDEVRAGGSALTSWGVIALATIVVVDNWDALGSD
jgi:hypothetical protein